MSASINVLQKVPGCKSAMTWTGETQAVHASSISFMSRGRIEKRGKPRWLEEDKCKIEKERKKKKVNDRKKQRKKY